MNSEFYSVSAPWIATEFVTELLDRKAPMTLSKYLAARGARGIWQLRVPVPTEYRREHGGPLERTKSLKATDRELASKRAVPILASWQSEWDGETETAASLQQSPTFDLSDIAIAVGYRSFLDAMEARRKLWGKASISYESASEQRLRDHQAMTQEYLQGDLTRWEEIADRTIKARDLPIKKGCAEYTSFVDKLARATLDAVDVFNRRSGGELDARPKSSDVVEAIQKGSLAAKPGESVLDLFDKYAEWRCEPGRKPRRRREAFIQDRVAVELFAEFVGRSRSVHSLSRDDAKSFRAMLSGFPTGRAKNSRLAGMSIEQCLQVAEKENLRTLSLVTQAKYLSILSPFFSWLVSDSPVAIPSNIFEGLNHRIERGENRRPPYSSAQLNTLLRSPVFHLCGGKGKEHSEGKIAVRDWRYWIPLLCMFTGSRITEVAQVRVDELTVRDGIAMILLSHDEGRGQFVKNKRKRLCVLHPTLFASGLSDFWAEQEQRAKTDGNMQLFPELTPDNRGLLGSGPSKWFRRYLERIGMKEQGGRDGLGAHAFRHTLSDAMRNAGFMDIEFGQLMLGHSNNTITSVYGSVPQGTPERLLFMIEAAFKSEPFVSVQLPWDHVGQEKGSELGD